LRLALASIRQSLSQATALSTATSPSIAPTPAAVPIKENPEAFDGLDFQNAGGDKVARVVPRPAPATLRKLRIARTKLNVQNGTPTTFPTRSWAIMGAEPKNAG
jgi:hypothetical protein